MCRDIGDARPVCQDIGDGCAVSHDICDSRALFGDVDDVFHEAEQVGADVGDAGSGQSASAM